MPGLGPLLLADVRNAHRAARARGPWKSADVVIVVFGLLLLAGAQGVVAWAVVRVLGDEAAAARLARALGGIPAELVAVRLLEGSLLVTVAAWLTLPVLTTGLDLRGRRLPPSQLLRHPLRVVEILAYSGMSTLARPPQALLSLTTLVALSPVLALPHPGAAAVAAVPFLALVVLISWAVGLGIDAVLTASRGREVALGLACALALLVALPAVMPPTRTLNGLEAVGPGASVLLISRDGQHGLLPIVARVAPGSAVVQAGVDGFAVEPFAYLAGLVAAGIAWTLWTFRRALLEPPRLGTGRPALLLAAVTRLPFLRDPLRALAEKELALLLRTMDAPLGLVVGLAGGAAVLAADGHAGLSAVALLPLIVVVEAAIPFNAFGLDRAGCDRYRLAPIDGRTTLLSKNVAWWWVAGLQAAPLLAALLGRHGPRIALSAALLHAALVLATTAWGNVVSIRAPTPREFWNFDSKEQAGGLTSLAFGVVASVVLLTVAVLTAVADAHLPTAGVLLPLGQAIGVGAAALAWAWGLSGAAREFDVRAEPMRRRLTS